MCGPCIPAGIGAVELMMASAVAVAMVTVALGTVGLAVARVIGYLVLVPLAVAVRLAVKATRSAMAHTAQPRVALTQRPARPALAPVEEIDLAEHVEFDIRSLFPR